MSEMPNLQDKQDSTIDLSKVTLKQIWDGLTTAQAIRGSGLCFAVCAAIATGGYELGKAHTESIDGQRLAEAAGKIGQYQADLSRLNDFAAQSNQSSAQLKEANDSANAIIADLKRQLSLCGKRNLTQSNCTFIHSQIKDAQKEIAGVRGWDVFSGGGGKKEDTEARVSALESRIAGYQRQLGFCGNTGLGEQLQ